MERIAQYLEKLGYTVEEQGSILRYLILIKKGVPIGFILPDYKVSLANKDDEQEILDVINFVQQNDKLDIVAGSEYLLATYIVNRLTTFYDTKNKVVSYVSYLVDEIGTVTTETYTDKAVAVVEFVTKTGMLNIDEIKGKGLSLKDAMINKTIAFLASKKSV